MSLTTETMPKQDKPIFDSGMELIWYLEDAYEQRNLQNFFSKLSSDFKKDFFKFKSQLEERFSENEQLRLYIHFLSKNQYLSLGVYTYEICWTKRYGIRFDSYWQRDCGKATIVLKKRPGGQKTDFFLYDIFGNNPFE